MNNQRDHGSRNPFTPTTASGGLRAADETSGRSAAPFVPEGWRRLATGLRGRRLYRVTPSGGGTYWEAEMTLNGKVVHRRFVQELHARAWLAPEPPPVIGLDLEERHGSFRTAYIAAAGHYGFGRATA